MKMNMNEALEWAADYCERNKLFEPVKNDRGYAHNSWTPPTPAQKLEIISSLAHQVTESQPTQVTSIAESAFLTCVLNDLINAEHGGGNWQTVRNVIEALRGRLGNDAS